MDGEQVQAMDVSTTAADQDEAQVTAEKVFSKSIDLLEMQLELSCTSVASSAYSAELIKDDLMDDVIDKTPMTQRDRTLYLLRHIGKKLRNEPAKAKSYMDVFMSIVASEASFKHLVERIGKVRRENPNNDKQILINFQDDLASLLQNSISSIATAAYAKELIPPEVKDAVVNPKARHDKLCISRILEEIRRQIASDPKKLKVFIQKVMIPMGPSVQHLTDTLVKGLREIPPDHC